MHKQVMTHLLVSFTIFLGHPSGGATTNHWSGASKDYVCLIQHTTYIFYIYTTKEQNHHLYLCLL